MVLLVAAGLLLRGLYQANTLDPGFPYEHVAIVTGDLRDLGYVGDELASLQRRLADEVRSLPGVAAVGYAADPPWAERSMSQSVRLPEDGDGGYRRFDRNHVSATYFDAVGVPIVRGRGFRDGELAETSTAVIVTAATAESLWPGREAIGRTLLARVSNGADRPLEVVGVVGDAQVNRLGEVHASYLYRPPERDFRHMLSLVVRGRRAFPAVAEDINAVLRRLGLALNVIPVEVNLSATRGLSALLSGIALSLGVLTLVLAAVGIVGVVSYIVSRRTREISIRLALGARAHDVLRAILDPTLRRVAIGVLIGGASAVAVARVLSSMLFGVSPGDPLGVGAAALFVLGVAFLASLVPAWRALRVDPARTLQSE